MEKIKYKVGLITYSQGELELGQDIALVNLYNMIKDKSVSFGEMRIKDLPDLLAKHNLLNKFFGIILRPRWDIIYILSFKWVRYLLKNEIFLKRASNTQIGEVFNDFFLLNKKYVNILKEYLNTLGLIAAETEKMKIVEKTGT